MPPRIAVETGVEIPDERGHSHSQALDDAIKISIIPDENEPLDVSFSEEGVTSFRRRRHKI